MALFATAVFACLLYFFLAEYEFVTTVSTTSAVSPDGRYTIQLDQKQYRNINRSWNTVELTLLNHAPATNIAMTAFHFPGLHFDASDELPDYAKLGNSIVWDPDSNGCEYRISNRENGKLVFQKNRWELIGKGR